MFVLSLLLTAAVAGARSHTDSRARNLGELNLEAGKLATEHTLSLLYNRYEMYDEAKLGVWLLRPFMSTDIHTWDMMKYKFALKMLTPRSKMHVVFSGSSVTAGHDNLLNESYAGVYERRMRGPLEALGVEFEFHNTAMGGQGCYPQNLCYESQGGDDADIYSWEQTYFCKGGSDKDMSVQSALRSKNDGLYMHQASGAMNYNSCKHKENKTYDHGLVHSDEAWTPAAAGLPEWKPTYEDVVKEREICTKPYSSIGGPYHGIVGNMATGSWSAMPNCQLPNCTGKLCGCSQFNVLENFCADLKVINPKMNEFHPTGRGARHHPTQGVHLIRGESIVWYHAMELLDAIYMVEHDLARGQKPGELMKEYRRVMNELRPKPSTLMTPADYNSCLDNHCDQKMECYNDYRPKFNDRLSLRNLVIAQNDWVWHNASLNGWQLAGGYLDTPAEYHCYVNETFNCGDLSIRIPTITVISEAAFLLTENYTIYIDLNVPAEKLKNYKAPASLQPWPHITYQSNHHRYFATDLPQGDHVATIRNNMPPEQLAKGQGSFSHLFTWKAPEE